MDVHLNQIESRLYLYAKFAIIGRLYVYKSYRIAMVLSYFATAKDNELNKIYSLFDFLMILSELKSLKSISRGLMQKLRRRLSIHDTKIENLEYYVNIRRKLRF
jgi:hypothetical protein